MGYADETFAVVLLSPGTQIQAVNAACERASYSEAATPQPLGSWAAFIPQIGASYLEEFEASALLRELSSLGAKAEIISTKQANQASSRHDVTIREIGPNRLAVMKAARAASGLELSAVKAALDELPVTLAVGLVPREAAAAAVALTEAGAQVEVSGVDELQRQLNPSMASSPAGHQTSRFCTNCGTEAPSGNFCGNCGAQLPPPVGAATENPGTSPSGFEFAAQGQWQLAEEQLQADAMSGDLDAAIAMVVLAQEKGDAPAASDWLTKAFELDFQRFNPSYLERDPDLAVINRFWKHGPNNGRGYIYAPLLMLAHSANELGLSATAQHWYLHAIAEGSYEAFSELAMLHDALGHSEQAEFWLSEARCVDGDLEEVGARIDLAQANNDFNYADQWIERAALLGDPNYVAKLEVNESLRHQFEVDRAPASENALARSLGEVISDGGLRDVILRGFHIRSGFNKDEVIGLLDVTDKLQDFPSSDQLMVVTRERVGFFRKGGFLREEVADAINASDIQGIGIGDSNHYEMAGFVGRGTEYLTITLATRQGPTFTRHFFLGHSEKDINKRLETAQEFFSGLVQSGWRITDGPGYRSSGGYRRTYSYGFGVWF